MATPNGLALAGAAFATPLYPKDETYYLPLKDRVRRKTNTTAGDVVAVEMTIRPPKR